MRQVLAIYPLASAMRYGPFFAGYWNSFVLAAHGAKHWGSELGSVTTLGGAASAPPAAMRAIAAATRVRYRIRASFFIWNCRHQSEPAANSTGVLLMNRMPDAGAES